MKITNVDQMDPFFISVVSDSNHWLFISSNTGLSAGRKDAENALFPYYTEDKITESYDSTGDKSIFWITRGTETEIWEPFSIRYFGKHAISRNLYKSEYGNKILFEEVNHDLGLIFRYQWNSSDAFGFVRKASIENISEVELQVRMIDGIQNIMPSGVDPYLQTNSSHLVNAYKRSELVPEAGLGIYALSALIVDRAEPSESLKANTVWSAGLNDPKYLLSSRQLDQFRLGREIIEEVDVKGVRGAYFLHTEFKLDAKKAQTWMIVANVNQSISSITKVSHLIKNDTDLIGRVNEDIDAGTQRLINLVSSSDGLQLTQDKRINVRHFSNTLFNIMRGGIFDRNYQIECWDFLNYLRKANTKVYTKKSDLIQSLGETFSAFELRQVAMNSSDEDFIRLSTEYLPLKFSRRHGDPSRPWNRFSINTKNELDGSKVLDYEGNWRDIFQNWEALAFSYPEFIDGMVSKFLNASTFDGYNPYRITKDGFDWEVEDEEDPWSYIGYWGDHQIIYLLKFLEFMEDHQPGKLLELFDKDYFVYADVPYRIKSYKDILRDPKSTIEFDEPSDRSIRSKREKIGADGAILENAEGKVHRVNFLEKILATTLAKLSNYVPEGGIWMNTQRPEWNDANNALVGNGISMVTLYYLRRFLRFFRQLLESAEEKDVQLSAELKEQFDSIKKVFESYLPSSEQMMTDSLRTEIVNHLGLAASQYRNTIYTRAFSGKRSKIKISAFKQLCDHALSHLEYSIRANKRQDGMYHAYNLLSLNGEKGMTISHLDEMLEGQVAVLSSRYLSSKEALEILDALKASSLYRADQYSYILYPNKELPHFIEKNNIPAERVHASKLLSKMVEEGNTSILEKDLSGKFHFNNQFNNARFLQEALDKLEGYDEWVKEERNYILNTYEEVFNHKAFTGRSGTFFGYEGLGSIYWHMVSKLLLATMECSIQAIRSNEPEEIIARLLEHFYEIAEGIGAHKPPSLYGAFPTDPYSHTPMGKGAQQPGMTGQVKEDIISRIGEMGVFVKNGCIHFNPGMLRAKEFLTENKGFQIVDISGNVKKYALRPGSLAFTYCQVPIIYEIAEREEIKVVFSGGEASLFNSEALNREVSDMIFKRTGKVESIQVLLPKSKLR